MGHRKMTTFGAGTALAVLAWMTLAPPAWHPLAWFSFRADGAEAPRDPAPARVPELTTAAERRGESVAEGSAAEIPDTTTAELAGETPLEDRLDADGPRAEASAPRTASGESEKSSAELLGSLAFSLPSAERVVRDDAEREEPLPPARMDRSDVIALLGARRGSAGGEGMFSRKGDSAPPAEATPKPKAAEPEPKAVEEEKPESAPEAAKAEPQPPAKAAPEPTPEADHREAVPTASAEGPVASEPEEDEGEGVEVVGYDEEPSAPAPVVTAAMPPTPTPMAIPREIPTPLQLAQRRLHPPAGAVPNREMILPPVAVPVAQAPAPVPAQAEPGPEKLTSLEVAAAPADARPAAPIAEAPVAVEAPQPAPVAPVPDAAGPETTTESSASGAFGAFFTEMAPAPPAATPEAMKEEPAPAETTEESPKAEPVVAPEVPKAEPAPLDLTAELPKEEPAPPMPVAAPQATPAEAPPQGASPEKPEENRESPQEVAPEAPKEEPISPPSAAPAAPVAPSAETIAAPEPAQVEEKKAEPEATTPSAPASMPAPLALPESAPTPQPLPKMEPVADVPLEISPQDLEREVRQAPAMEEHAPAPLPEETPESESPPAPEPAFGPKMDDIAAAPAKEDPFAEPSPRPPMRALLPDKNPKPSGRLVDPFNESVDPFEATPAPDGAVVSVNMTTWLAKRVAAPIPTVRVQRSQSPDEEAGDGEGDEPPSLPPPTGEDAASPPSPPGAGAGNAPRKLPEPPALAPLPAQGDQGPGGFPEELIGAEEARPKQPKPDDGFTPAGGQPPATAPAAPMPPMGQSVPIPNESSTPAAAAPAAPTPAPAPTGNPGGASPGLDRLPEKHQELGLTVDVYGLNVANLGKPAKFQVIVRNTSKSDLSDVVVRGTLPENFEYTESQPEPERQGQVLTWAVGTLLAGSEKSMLVHAIPRSTGTFEFGATVSVRAGAKARTNVLEPKLEAKIVATPTQVLKGRPVRFQIEIRNPGTGVARDVTVMARLSPGLKHALGSSVVQKMIGNLNPGDVVRLDPSLDLDTVAGGEQACEITVTSPDVPKPSEAATSKAVVNVVEPQLAFKLNGPPWRYTDMAADYEVVLDNPGTAPATRVRVEVVVPAGATLISRGTGQYSESTRRLMWEIPQVEPGKPMKLPFRVRLGGIQVMKIAGAAYADNGLRTKASVDTDVVGLADPDVTIDEKQRILDVGGTTTFEIRITNKGSKDATHVKISAALSDNLDVVSTPGLQGKAHRDNKGNVQFPEIARIGPGESTVLNLKVQAKKAGAASCQVNLIHDDIGNVPIVKTIVATITEEGAARR